MLLPSLAFAVPPVQRSFFTLPSSNGFGAVMADTRTAKVVHFREHLPANEEPRLDSSGAEVWVGNQPQVVATRDLLFDAYFGLRAGGQQRWLSMAPDSSGYDTASPATSGGSGVVTWHQAALGLEATTFVFAPRSLPHAAFVMALRLENTGSSAVSGVSAFSLQNLHLGYGRPGVMQKVEANGESVTVLPGRALEERGFAGVVVARPVGPVSRAAAWNGASASAQNAWQVVNAGGTADLVDRTGALGVADDWATGYQFDLGTLAPGAVAWVAVVFAHHGDPFAASTVQGWLDTWVGSRTAEALVTAERAEWSSFQASLQLPAGLSAEEAIVARQSAAVLAMAQVKETDAFLREWLTRDGEARRSRFPLLDGGAGLPGTVRHRGAGAVLASLPPGEWTVAWARDGAFAAAALSSVHRTAEAREALRFLLDAEGGRFRGWSELSSYNVAPYVISLVRYQGFGVEETDFNSFGPNLEFDGFGLFLWALRQHELATGDTSLADARWSDIATLVAEPLAGLVDPATGLLRADSSIWETHWNGRQRAWTWTTLTAVRGLCDAAAIAERRGDTAHAQAWRATATSMRAAMAKRLTDSSGALASNLEELQSGRGYFDAAVFAAVSLGLFDPRQGIAAATMSALEQKLRVAAGPGWARNDDRTDHGAGTDLSPWGSDYDSAEWAFTDLLGAVALRAGGQTARADAVLDWVTHNAAQNAGLVPETFDEATSAWKFNAPMVGFGAGAYLLALAQRAAGTVEPACGAYFAEGGGVSVADAGLPERDAGAADGGPPDSGRPDAGSPAEGDAGPSGGGDAGGLGTKEPGTSISSGARAGCGCNSSGAGMSWVAVLALTLARRRS